MGWGRRAAVVTAAVAAVGLLASGLGGTASADTDLRSAQAKAAALRVTVDRLQAEVEAATENYGEANQELDAVVTQLIIAEQGVDDASVVANAERAHTDDVAAQMYMSGGPTALYASVLSGGDISDVLDRMASVNAVVDGQIVATAASQRAVTAAKVTSADLAVLAARRRVLEDRRAAAANQARMLQAQATAALASADAEVLRLVEEQRQAAEAAAAAAAAAQLGTASWAAEPVPADSYAAVDRAIAEATADPGTPYAVGAITDARRWLGTPYSAGGGGVNGPSTGWCSSSAPDDGRNGSGACMATQTVGFDCSSLMVRIFSAAGRKLPRTSREQWKIGVHVPLSELKPGDLLFWANDLSNPGSIHHVALYIGHGLMIHSPHTGDHVRVAKVYLNGLIGAVRPV
ncbi:MAG TPA: NlpC/P60 family protein [Candidatus Nanopelagicales bacterium]|nr:NlpC/P60 family protein [Candidatus Nanopelagicales bacterium]